VHGTRFQRYKEKMFRQNQDEVTDDPVIMYKRAIEECGDYLLDIKNQPAQKNEQFISIEYGQLKQSLIDIA